VSAGVTRILTELTRRLGRLVVFASGLCLAAAASQATGDAKAGRQKALACQGCHGLDGLSKQPDAPHIAGQPMIYFTKAINEYKSKARRHEQMSIVAASLSEADIADLAAYYGAISVSVEVPKR
jgi:cytochrome c553